MSCVHFQTVAVHFVTRKSELERILLSGVYSYEIQKKFTASLKASRQLVGLKRAVFAETGFEVTAMVTAFVEAKRMSTKSAAFRTTYDILPC